MLCFLGNNSTACELCESVIDIVRADVIISNTTVKDLSILVTTLCYMLGGSIIRSECNFIIKNINYIYDWIIKKMPTKEICAKLRLCKN